MARVINTDSPGKRRGNLMRTVAELQRRLEGESGFTARELSDALAICH